MSEEVFKMLSNPEIINLIGLNLFVPGVIRINNINEKISLRKESVNEFEYIKYNFDELINSDYGTVATELKIKNQYYKELDQVIKRFKEYMGKRNIDQCINNLKTLNVKHVNTNDFKDFFAYIFKGDSSIFCAGSYDRIENTISLYNNNPKVLTHEFLHMCSTNFEKSNTGFSIHNLNLYSIGLNEGYTEVLNSRIFNYGYDKCSYKKAVKLSRLIEAFFENPSDMEDAYFNNDFIRVYKEFCKYGSKEEFFDFIFTIDNFVKYPMFGKDVVAYFKMQFKLYEIIKRSNDIDKISKFEKILAEDKMVCLLKGNQFKLIKNNEPNKKVR